MKKALSILAMTIALFLLSMGVNLAQQEQEVKFNRPEIERMLSFFNETPIKGQDLDVLAPLAGKLKEGVRQASAFNETSQLVNLRLSGQEAGLFLIIINNATFQARYVDLVLKMKHKLYAVAPPQTIGLPGMKTN